LNIRSRSVGGKYLRDQIYEAIRRVSDREHGSGISSNNWSASEEKNKTRRESEL
jgi:hypothetical protein